MHEVSLNQLITDYVSGREIMDTTYEDLRQALARMLVEVFTPDSRPALALFFHPGEVGTFVRQSVAAARIHEPAPFPLVVVTDSMEALVVETRTAAEIGRGFYQIPRWGQMEEMLTRHPCSGPAGRREKDSGRLFESWRAMLRRRLPGLRATPPHGKGQWPL